MKGLKTAFKDEEAASLLNYFISCKEIIGKAENKNKIAVEIDFIPKIEIVIK